MHEIIFYNGFNLLIDLIIGGLTYIIAFRIGWHTGLRDGAEIRERDGYCDHIYESYCNRCGTDADDDCSFKPWHPLYEADGTYLAEHQD